MLGLAGLRLAGSGGRGAPDAPEGGRVAAAPAPAPPAAPDPPAPEDPLAGLPPPADPASFDGERDLFGVVVDVEGRPVPGAAVTASFRPYGDVFFLGFEESRARVPGPSTRSARDGTFLLPLPRGTWCDLRAEAPGVGEAQAGWRVAGERVRLVLREARSLLVRALDAGGNPVAGLRLHPSWMDESRRTCQLPSGTTGADGTCLLRSLPAGRIWFTLEHPDLRGPSPAEAVVPERGTGSFEIRLSPPRVVEGIVVDARTRAPLPGAVVGDGYLLLHARAAGPDGRFSFPCDPLDSRTVVHARAPGYAPGSSAPGADGTLEIALRPGAAAEGRLLGEGGRPADGVRVDVIGYAPKASGWSGAQAASARTGDGGRFRLEGLRAGTSYTMVCEAPGRGRLVRDFAAAAEEGGTADLGDILLPPSRSIEGILLDEAGEPLPDRPVVLHGPLGEVAPSGRSLDVGRRTDDRGRFRFAGRSPGAYRVAAGADARSAGAALDVLLPEDGDLADLVLRVPAAVRAEILVTDPAGEPVPGMGLLLLGPAGNAQLRSDERGRASAPVIPGESYRLHATDLSVPVRWVSALPGGTPVEPGAGEVRLVVRRAAQVRGRVVGGDGLPVEGATVTAREAGGPGSWSLRTLSDGRFDFPVPRGARLEVAAAGEGGSRSRAVEALAPGEDVDLRLEGGGRLVLRVRVLDAEGRPVPGIPLDAPVVQGREPTTDRRGEALLRGLGAGAIRVGVRPGAALPEGAAAPPPAEADPADGEVVLRLREGVPIEGLVLGPDGLPAPGAAVRLLCADGSGAGAAADGTGRFRALVGPGTAVLRAEARWTDAGGEPRTALLEGAAAGAAVLEFRLR